MSEGKSSVSVNNESKKENTLTKKLGDLLTNLEAAVGKEKYPEMLASVKNHSYWEIAPFPSNKVLQILIDLHTLLDGAPATVICYVEDLTLEGAIIKKFQTETKKRLFGV